MRFIADLHIHSHHSVATSKFLRPEYLDAWAQLKGIALLGTGDAVHPGWLQELEEKLRPADEEGLFVLDPAHALDESACYVPPSCRNTTRFMLTAELSSIYKKDGKVRKVHNLICLPSFEAARALQRELAKRGNIESDGRPILGVDSRDILEILLSVSEEAFLVPAHIWTPWFSVLGSKSGFDTIEECYGDLTPHVFAVETGLSSDPEMNWMCSFLDDFTLISNSDAHSPEKLGREANIFDCPLSFSSIRDALATRRGFLGTIEFFPQEGKYHYDGHRKCGVRFNPVETLRHGGICPSCGGKLTVGVMNRVAELADREPEDAPESGRIPFRSITSLASILAEIHEKGENTRTVKNAYISVLEKHGPEFSVLLETPVEEMEETGHRLLGEAVRRMRAREVIVEEGFDGQFGAVRLFRPGEKETFLSGAGLFHVPGTGRETVRSGSRTVEFSVAEYKKLLAEREAGMPVEEAESPATIIASLNPEQRRAVEHYTGPCMIIAGPGTGKTLTLTARIAHLIRVHGVRPDRILAVTFTNKAAEEMRERLARFLPEHAGADGPLICTLHALGLAICRRHAARLGRKLPLTVIGEEEKLFILENILCLGGTEARRHAAAFSRAKQRIAEPDDPSSASLFSRYEELLVRENILDMDDCIRLPVLLLESSPEIREQESARRPWICVDEYQDINHAQYRLIRALASAPDADLCVIGDPDQSIYGFRGADAACIRNFTRDYPAARVYRLKKSYRCTSRILEASRQVLDSDAVLEGLESGVKITIKEEDTDRSEAEYIARTIERLVGGVSFFSIDSAVTDGDQDAHIGGLSDFAVLFRVSRMGELIAEAMRNHNIPYRLVGTDSRVSGHPYLDFLRLAVNPAHAAAEQRLRRAFRGTGGPDIRTFAASLRELAPEEALGRIRDAYGVPEGSGEKTRALLDLAARAGGDIEAFLSAAVLGRDIDAADLRAEHVLLMTLHAAKGLEFKCVFIAGCEEGIIPYTLFGRDSCDIEEERRVLYVGMTRAKRYLYLTNAKRRTLFGRSLSAPRSRFVERIRRDLVKKEKRTARKKRRAHEDDHLTFF